MLILAKAEGIDYRLLHQAADRLTPKLRQTLLAAFENLPEATLTPLIAALEAGRIDQVMDLLAAAIDPAAQAQVANVLREAFVGAANLQGAEFNLRFDIKNPAAVRFAERNAARLVTSVDVQTRRALRDIVVRGIQDGMAPAVQAREIRQLIGLSRRDATAADNFLRGLLETATSEKQEAAALRRFETYQRRLLRNRAETIARTETIRAANMGQRAAWDKAADVGLLDRATLRVVWIATEDSRTCPICAVLDGQTVGFQDDFLIREQATGFNLDSSGEFQVSGTKPVSGGPHAERSPPAHTACRCALGLTEIAV